MAAIGVRSSGMAELRYEPSHFRCQVPRHFQLSAQLLPDRRLGVRYQSSPTNEIVGEADTYECELRRRNGSENFSRNRARIAPVNNSDKQCTGIL